MPLITSRPFFDPPVLNSFLFHADNDIGYVNNGSSGATITNSGTTFDTNANNRTFGPSSVYLNNAPTPGQTFSVSANPAHEPQSGQDWTLDLRVKMSGGSTDRTIMTCINPLSPNGGFKLWLDLGVLKFYGWDGGIFSIQQNGSFPLNSFPLKHVAIVKSSGVYTMYIDGVAQTSTHTMVGSEVYSGRAIQFGNDDNGADWFDGYLDEIRIIPEAAWTTNFTPPTSPYV